MGATALARMASDASTQGEGAARGMSDEQFCRWVGLLEARTGMTLPQERRSFLVTSLSLRMRELGFTDVDSYYDFVTTGLPGKVEWTTLVDRLTVHETRFFRDQRAIRLLTDSVLDELCNRPQRDGRLAIWSVGCSTGEEVYSLAMVVDRHLADSGASTRFGITGTDISLQALSVAKRAEYARKRARDIPEAYASRYCESVDEARFRIARSLRRRVCFAQLNAIESADLPPRRMDLIYCQNLLIYFDRPRRLSIVNGLVAHLKPGGVLLLGAGELLHWSHPDMQRLRNSHDVLAFRRSAHPARRAAVL